MLKYLTYAALLACATWHTVQPTLHTYATPTVAIY